MEKNEVKLKATGDVSSISIEGVEYTPDKSGVFTLPAEAAAVAIADFGFVGAKADK